MKLLQFYCNQIINNANLVFYQVFPITGSGRHPLPLCGTIGFHLEAKSPWNSGYQTIFHHLTNWIGHPSVRLLHLPSIRFHYQEFLLLKIEYNLFHPLGLLFDFLKYSPKMSYLWTNCSSFSQIWIFFLRLNLQDNCKFLSCLFLMKN